MIDRTEEIKVIMKGNEKLLIIIVDIWIENDNFIPVIPHHSFMPAFLDVRVRFRTYDPPPARMIHLNECDFFGCRRLDDNQFIGIDVTDWDKLEAGIYVVTGTAIRK